MLFDMNCTRSWVSCCMIWMVQGFISYVWYELYKGCELWHSCHTFVSCLTCHTYMSCLTFHKYVWHTVHTYVTSLAPLTRGTWYVVQHEWCKWHDMLYNMNDTNVVQHEWYKCRVTPVTWLVSNMGEMCHVSHTCVMSHTHVWCRTHMCDVTRVTSMGDVTRFTHMCVWCHTFHTYMCVKHICETCDITHVTSHSVITGHVTRVTHVCGVTRFTHMCGVSLLVQGVWVTSHICVTKDTYTHTYVWCHTYVWQKIHTITNMCDVTRFTRMCATRVRVEHTRRCETCAHICVVSHYWYKERESRHTYVWQKIHTLTHMSHICVALVTFKEHNIARLRFICVTCHIKSSSSRCVSHVWHVWRKIRHVWQEIHNTLMCDNRQQIRHVWQQIHNTLPLNLWQQIQQIRKTLPLSEWVSVMCDNRYTIHSLSIDPHSHTLSRVSYSHYTHSPSEWVSLTLYWEWGSVYICRVS